MGTATVASLVHPTVDADGIYVTRLMLKGQQPNGLSVVPLSQPSSPSKSARNQIQESITSSNDVIIQSDDHHFDQKLVNRVVMDSWNEQNHHHNHNSASSNGDEDVGDDDEVFNGPEGNGYDHRQNQKQETHKDHYGGARPKVKISQESPVKHEPADHLRPSESEISLDATGDQSTGSDCFQRDGFGRQSMSEKRHAHLDAKTTQTYQKSKEFRDEMTTRNSATTSSNSHKNNDHQRKVCTFNSFHC